MTYEKIVDKVREAFENADAREIFEHVAMQVNIVGEGEGAFYIEVAERHISVEPYDYYDRDGLFTASAEVLVQLAEGKLNFCDAVASGKLVYAGNQEKLKLLGKIKLRKKPTKSKSTKKS